MMKRSARTTTPQEIPSSTTGPVFPLSKIKSFLQRNEGVGIVTKPSLELVSAASAAFIKSLVEAAVQHKSTPEAAASEETRINDDSDQDSGKTTMITLEDLRRAVSAEARFRFLSDALNGPCATAALQGEDDRAPKRPRKARKKRHTDHDPGHRSIETKAKPPPGRIKDPPPAAAVVASDIQAHNLADEAARWRRIGDDNADFGEERNLPSDGGVGAALPRAAGPKKPAIEVDEEEYD